MRVDHIPKSEQQKLLKHLSFPHSAIWLIGQHTGLRVSDILTLSRQQLLNGRPTIVCKKTGKHKRVYIPQKARELVVKNSSPDKAYPLQVSRQAVYKAFKAAKAKADIKSQIGTHSMRKSYAWRLKDKGKSYSYIQAQLQHESIGDTLRYLIDGEEQKKV